MKHHRHHPKLLSNILNKKYIYRDISLPRLGKNMGMALQNMTEPPQTHTHTHTHTHTTTHTHTPTHTNIKLCASLVKGLVLQALDF